ncbi:MAG TPA: hypothetical protein VFX15_11825 [Actinomycetes bacterium]|nr:hypothetical protein [Actinomycetes bacterium]
MSSTPLTRIATTMQRQAGVISRRQALASGMTERQLDYQLPMRRWTALHRGVYLSSDAPLTWEARAHASVLAAGDGAVLVAETAAALRSHVPERLPITVAIPESRRRALPSWANVLRLEVPMAERVIIRHLPTTTRLRTAIDIAHLMPASQAQPVLDRMLVRDEVDLAALTAAVEASRRAGSRQARKLLASANDLAAAESERLARRLLRGAGLTDWVSNYPVTLGGTSMKLDLANLRLRIGIEVKGWIFHSKSDRAASDDDRVVAMQLGSWIVIPVGWLTLNAHPQKFLDQVKACIEARKRYGVPASAA